MACQLRTEGHRLGGLPRLGLGYPLAQAVIAEIGTIGPLRLGLSFQANNLPLSIFV